jgi:hypothetical protein
LRIEIYAGVNPDVVQYRIDESWSILAGGSP